MEASQDADLQKHNVQQLTFNGLQTVLAIAMVGVGAEYRADCNNGAALFLLIGGGIMLFVNIVSLFAIATPCKYDDIFMKALAPAIGLIQTCVFLGGTIVVFGTYDKWTDKLINRDEPGYCAYSPYMFAFVLLLLEWVLMPIFICLVCCVICGFSMSLG